MKFLLAILASLALLLSCGGSGKAQEASAADQEAAAFQGRSFKVFIVMDTVDLWSAGARDGFKASLDLSLKAMGASAAYTELDTALDKAKAAAIKDRIEAEKPDLVCTLVYPDGFANIEIAQKLALPGYRFVSMDPVPVQDGTIASYDKPGGNITGVGVYIQMNSLLKLARKIDPALNTLYFYSWRPMVLLNRWFEAEVNRACEEEGWELEFTLIDDAEEEFAFLERFAEKIPGALVTGGISAFVDRAGKAYDMKARGHEFYTSRIKTPFSVFEDVLVSLGYPFGTVISWGDIGAQLADKAMLILGGTDPGTIPWDYPRKYDVMINLAAMERLGYKVPQDVLDAAAKVYTDYLGNYAGKP